MFKSRDFVLEEAQSGAPICDLTIDITREICPMTFVRTRLALDGMQPGQVLRVDLRGDEPRQNVPRAAEALGHAIIAEQTSDFGVTSLLIRKGGAPA
jgi:TusA-related sulfurtransferase